MPIDSANTVIRHVGRPVGAQNLTVEERATPEFANREKERKRLSSKARRDAAAADSVALATKVSNYERELASSQLKLAEAKKEVGEAEREHYRDELCFVEEKLLVANAYGQEMNTENHSLKKTVREYEREIRNLTEEVSRLKRLYDVTEEPRKRPRSSSAFSMFGGLAWLNNTGEE